MEVETGSKVVAVTQLDLRRDFRDKAEARRQPRGLDVLEGTAGQDRRRDGSAREEGRLSDGSQAAVRRPAVNLGPRIAQDPALRRAHVLRARHVRVRAPAVVPVRPRRRTRSSSRPPTSTRSRSAASSAAGCPAASTSRPSRCARARPSPTRSSPRSTSRARGRPRSVRADRRHDLRRLRRQDRHRPHLAATSRSASSAVATSRSIVEAPILPARTCRCARCSACRCPARSSSRSTSKLPIEKPKCGKHGDQLAEGRAATSTLACPSGCTFGDGKTKLKPLAQEHAQRRRWSARASTSARSTSTSLVAQVDDQERQARRSTSSTPSPRTASSRSTTR